MIYRFAARIKSRYNLPSMPKLSGWLVFAFLAMMALQAPGAGQPGQPQVIDVQELGPQVGHQVPDFRLMDQNGKTWTRQSIMGPKGGMLVFFRSADW